MNTNLKMIGLRAIESIALVLVWTLLTGLGPWERTPGGKLLGEIQTRPVSDWSFVQQVPNCAVETRPQYPHSVTVNCWDLSGQLYIGCMNCAEKIWSRYLMENPLVRVRVEETIYPVLFEQVVDDGEMNAAWQARWQKMGRPSPAPAAPEHYVLYRVTSR